MLEKSEVKARFERCLELSQTLAALKQSRDGINAELNRLPDNRNYLELKGKSIHGESVRLKNELATISEQESDVRCTVQEFFNSLIRELNKPIQDRLSEFLSKRLRIRALLTEAVDLFEELEKLPNEWDRDMQALKKMMMAAKWETGETYRLPECPFPAAFVPAPSRSAIESGKTSLILKHVAGQIS